MTRFALVVLLFAIACGDDAAPPRDSGPADVVIGRLPDSTAGLPDAGTDASTRVDSGNAPNPCESCVPTCQDGPSMTVPCAGEGVDCSSCLPPCDVWELGFPGFDLEPYCDPDLKDRCVNVNEPWDDTGPFYLDTMPDTCVPG